MRSPIKNLKKTTNSLSVIKELIPKGAIVQTYPFYDGAIEFSLAESDRYCVGCTKSAPVHEFWQYASKDPKRVSLMADKLFFALNENTFDLLRKGWHRQIDPYMRSASFFLLNRCSKLGMITHGELDTKNFNPISINELRTFKIKNFHSILIPASEEYERIDRVDFNLFNGGRYYFDLLDTEPAIGLEESPFSHSAMLSRFKQTPSIFVYQYHPRLSKMKGYSIIFLDQYGRKTTEDKAKEIILHNV
jgi:hypothetical protein